MIPAYCITCDPRREQIARLHFAARGLDVQFVQGINGDSWCLASTKPYGLDGNNGFVIAPKHVGIDLSHWMLWQHIYLAGHDEALILEDDAELVPDFVERFTEAQAALPQDWQFVLVGYLESAGVIARKTKAVVSPQVIRTREVFGTHCYLVRRNALPILMQTSAIAWAPSDIQIDQRSLPHLNHYTLARPLAVQRETPEAITKEALKLQGWCSDEKMAFLFNACLAARGGVYLEVGVFGGKSFLPAAAGIGPTGTAYAIDPWEVAPCIAGETPENVAWWTENAGLQERYREFLAAVESSGIKPQTRIVRKTSLAAVHEFADGSVDVLHIDGNHRNPLADFQAWLPKLKTGGVLVVDDTENDGWPEIDAALPWIRERCREIHAGQHYRAFEKAA